MQRYCFYCGRELLENERCHCRERKQSGSGFDPSFHPVNRTQDSTDQKTQTKQSSNKTNPTQNKNRTSTQDKNRSGNPKRSLKNRFRAFYTHAQNARASRRPGGRSGTSNRSKTQGFRPNYGKTSAGPNEPITLRSLGYWALRMLGSPREFSREVLQSRSRLALILAIVQESLFMGILFSLIVRRTSLATLMRFSLGSETLSIWPVFVGGVLFSMSFFFLKSFLAKLFAQTGARLRLSFRQAMYLQVPGTYYSIFFILLAMLASVGSGFQAITLLIAAAIMRGIIDFITWRDAGKINENQGIILIAFTYIILLLIVALLADTFFPGISQFQTDGMSSAIQGMRTILL